MILGQAVVLLAAQFLAAEVAIRVDGDSAIVVARYRWAPGAGDARVSIARRVNQHVIVGAVASSIGLLGPGDGLVRLAYPNPSADSVLEIRYVVQGDVSRVPLPVPGEAFPEGQGAARIRLAMTEADPALIPRFPRFARSVGGEWVAQLDNLPSFVRLERAGAQWSVGRVTEMLVAVLVLGGLAVGAFRMRRRAERLGVRRRRR